jgi:ABC-type lipoprotein release transport system permease subunit
MAWRNIGRNPRRTGIVVTAVSVGLAGVLLAMAINYGMVFQMIETAIATQLGHLQIHGAGFDRKPGLEIRIEQGERLAENALDGLSGLEAWAPRIRSQGLVFSPRANVGVEVVGIDPLREARVSVLADSIVAGEYLNGKRRKLLLGEKLASRLHVGVGDKLVLSVQDVNGEMTGEAFRVGGLFRTADGEFDRGSVFLRIDESQRLLGLGDDVSELVVIADQRDGAADLKRAIQASLSAELAVGRVGDLEVRTWEEIRPVLVYFVDLFEQMGWAVYGAVFVAMAFGIANVLLMSVYERIREIGILMAIGMGPRRLVTGIAIESLLLTLLGVGIGLGVGVLSIWLLRGGIDLSRWAEGLTAYGVGTEIVPVIRAKDLIVPTLVAIVTAVLASLWPALRAVRIRPADAVRHI